MGRSSMKLQVRGLKLHNCSYTGVASVKAGKRGREENPA
jgi:hypothetical protein